MSPSVLLLEDDLAIRDVIGLILEDDGIAARTCHSVEEAVQVARELPSPLLIADFWGTSHQILAAAERDEIVRVAEVVPTIMVTARSWAAEQIAADLGLVALVRKPFIVDDLRQAVASWIASGISDSAAAREQARQLRGRVDAATSRMEAAEAELRRVMTLCGQCGGQEGRMYQAPARSQAQPGAPTILCYFCFIRIAGRRPTRRELMPPSGR